MEIILTAFSHLSIILEQARLTEPAINQSQRQLQRSQLWTESQAGGILCTIAALCHWLLSAWGPAGHRVYSDGFIKRVIATFAIMISSLFAYEYGL